MQPVASSSRPMTAARLEQTERELSRLRREFTAWIEDRRKKDTLHQYHTQLTQLQEAVTPALGWLEEEAENAKDQPTLGEVYRRCRQVDEDRAVLHRVWDYYRTRFDQRDAGPYRDLLRAADEVVWSCHAEVYRNAGLTPPSSRWTVRDGLLVNTAAGTDLLTEQKFTDFKLHTEFRYPKGSNSGIYLRGRYEVQIEDNYGLEPDSHYIGGVYGFLTPSVNAAKPAGEWQSFDITLVGRVVTIELNGERIIDRQTIPGITGGALDNDEAAPGPILLQGDHGPIDFRKVTLTPAR